MSKVVSLSIARGPMKAAAPNTLIGFYEQWLSIKAEHAQLAVKYFRLDDEQPRIGVEWNGQRLQSAAEIDKAVTGHPPELVEMARSQLKAQLEQSGAGGALKRKEQEKDAAWKRMDRAHNRAIALGHKIMNLEPANMEEFGAKLHVFLNWTVIDPAGIDFPAAAKLIGGNFSALVPGSEFGTLTESDPEWPAAAARS